MTMKRETERMMEKLEDKGYKNLTHEERFQLAVRYKAAGDEEAEQRLKETAPREQYEQFELDLVNRFDRAEELTEQAAWNLLRGEACLNLLENMTGRETETKTIENYEGEEMEVEVPTAAVGMIEQRSRELFQHGFRCGMQTDRMGEEPDAETVDPPEEVPEHLSPADTLQHHLQLQKKVYAGQTLDVFDAFDAVAQGVLDVELTLLFRSLAPQVLPIVERCRQIMDATEEPERYRGQPEGYAEEAKQQVREALEEMA
jgi:hypothetical protein